MLDFARLVAGLERVRRQLAALGLGRGDRVALLAPDGPELALLFLGATAQATAVPLNPRGDPDTLSGYLADARARALVAPFGHEAAARLAAVAGIPLLTFGGSAFDEGVSIEGPALGPACALSDPARADVAYVLGTAGTTGRPKVVPVTHAMVVSSCRAMIRWLALGPSDRCLDPMPLFHSHGLLNGLIWPLAAGGSTICPRRFDPASAPRLLRALGPTWTTAVPAILRAMANALRGTSAEGQSGLRFVRSSSAPLSPDLFAELESVFGAPVIETYGLTETGPLTTSPLAPGAQRPGKAGIACGPEVRIVDARGEAVGPGVPGEIVARGPTVTREYEANPAATAEAFRDGWFHTGDLGWLDEEGYLVVGGRLKEVIRRGGEGIAPLEVDRALASHPDVAEGACFAIPHPTLGEEVGAAVVLVPGAAATPDAIRDHAAARLPAWMVPRTVRIVEALPRSPAGKVVRRTLATQLGLEGPAAEPRPSGAGSGPLSAIETALVALWASALGRPVNALDADFGLSGGDSLSAVALVASVNEVFATSLPIESALGEGRTIARMRDLILAERGAGGEVLSGELVNRVPATPGQRRQWLHSLTRRDEPVNTISAALLLTGALDRARLQHAADAVARRHDALRTTFALEAGAQGRVLIQSALPDAPWPIEAVPPVPRDGVQAALAKAVQRPFVLAGGPPRRLVLVPIADEPGTHALVLALHHAIADGWSKEIVLDDLARAYAQASQDREPTLSPAPSWLAAARRRHVRPPAASLVEAAQARLAGLVPAGWPQVGTPPDWRATRLPVSVDPALARALRNQAEACRVTLFTLLLCAFADTMAAVLDREDGPMGLGVPLANRGPGEAGAVGPFSNATLVAVDASRGDPCRGLRARLAGVQARVMQAVAQQSVAIESATAGGGPGAWRSASFELPVLFQLQSYDHFRRREAGPILFQRLPFDSGIAQADLSVEIADIDGGLACDVVARRSGPPRRDVEALMAGFLDSLASYVAAKARP